MLDIFWTNLSEAQGALLNGILTILAAGGGVLLGAKLFGGKVANIQSAIDASKRAVDGHVDNMDHALKLMKEKTEALSEVLAGLSSQVGRIESNQIESERPDEDIAGAGPEASESESYTKDDISELWSGARDHLEEIASSPEIDGRTRAKYTRIDRRSYERLIDALSHDGFITNGVADAARQASAMSRSFRRREAPPTRSEIEEMKVLVGRVLEQARPDA
ncbi:hypothetical protein [Paracoccus aminophilus]|uniref:hypothetical protein n=1 Tax=Paracoccus aminophilus TaxID=34003 RepID=UPI0011DD4BB4|nr:hypothetical protein [Paracoccus aminophilus]